MSAEKPILSNAPYEQALDLVQQELDKFPHGYLKEWCEKHNLTYPTVVGIKKKSIDWNAYYLVEEILTALGYKVILIKYNVKIGSDRKGRTIVEYTVTKP